MKIQSRYSKSFYSDRLSDTKYQEIYSFAVYLNEIKNKISKEVNSNLLFYLDMSKYEFVTFMREKHKGKLPSNVDAKLFEDIIIAYQNKFDGINRRIKFEKIYEFQINLYKKKTKEHSKGDFKGISKKTVWCDAGK